MRDCLIVVDLQNDFCKGGALEVPWADEIVPIINRLLPQFRVKIGTQDSHPPNHCSFKQNGGQWPEHCVAGTRCWEFHPALRHPLFDAVIRKGADPTTEAYSAFHNTGLNGLLDELEVEEVYVCGLATDFCVKATALDRADGVFDTFILPFACRAVGEKEGRSALAEMQDAGVEILNNL